MPYLQESRQQLFKLIENVIFCRHEGKVQRVLNSVETMCREI